MTNFKNQQIRQTDVSYKTVNRGTTFGVKFRPEFDMKLLRLQASHDRWTYNKLLETLKDEYKRYGRVNCSRGRISKWYTEMRREHPFLQQTVSRISRGSLFALGYHYEQYVETERLKAADIVPEWEFGEPHFKRYGETISLPITITHDKIKGSAWFDGHRAIRISKMGEVYLSREFPMLNYRPKVYTTEVTHTVFEKLPIQNMVKSAKGTKEKPGKRVAQKRGLNKAILNQGWGILAVILSYMLAGGIIRIDPTYTSHMCSLCLHVNKDSRCGRLFRCVRCGFIHHADINAGCNIENHGRKMFGLPRRIINSLSTRVDTASGIGLQDVEGGFTTDQMVNFTVSQMANGGHSVKRQVWTEVEGVVSAGAHVVRLWDDV